jgi:hypothetical protein
MGVFFGIAVSLYFARAESARDGALAGAITVVPTGIYITYLTNLLTRTTQHYGLLGAMPSLLLCVVLLSGFGALFGLILAILLRKVREKNWIL